MKKTNKFFALLLALVMLVSVIACSSETPTVPEKPVEPDKPAVEKMAGVTLNEDIQKIIDEKGCLEPYTKVSFTKIDNVEIYFTTDGSNPTKGNPAQLYHYYKNFPTMGKEDMTLKVQVFDKSGKKAPSDVQTFTIVSDKTFREPVEFYADAAFTTKFETDGIGDDATDTKIFIKPIETSEGDIFYTVKEGETTSKATKYTAEGINLIAPTDNTEKIYTITAWFQDAAGRSKDTSLSYGWLKANKLFITQAYEGKGYNKFIIITNTGNEAIDLVNYKYSFHSDTKNKDNEVSDPIDFALSGILGAGKSLVLHSNQLEAEPTETDATPTQFAAINALPEFDEKNPTATNDKNYRIATGNIQFNGNDGVALYRMGKIVDAVKYDETETGKEVKADTLSVRTFSETPTIDTPWTFTSSFNIKYSDYNDILGVYTAEVAAKPVTKFWIGSVPATEEIIFKNTGNYPLTWISLNAEGVKETGTENVIACGSKIIEDKNEVIKLTTDKDYTFNVKFVLRNPVFKTMDKCTQTGLEKWTEIKNDETIKALAKGKTSAIPEKYLTDGKLVITGIVSNTIKGPMTTYLQTKDETILLYGNKKNGTEKINYDIGDTVTFTIDPAKVEIKNNNGTLQISTKKIGKDYQAFDNITVNQHSKKDYDIYYTEPKSTAELNKIDGKLNVSYTKVTGEVIANGQNSKIKITFENEDPVELTVRFKDKNLAICTELVVGDTYTFYGNMGFFNNSQLLVGDDLDNCVIHVVK